ncbi:MAG: hypothetical protein LUE17_15725 [Planctomycetaceae bacterium]|nr:hypothetical protein [Planctomycetaceae bacterium]
MQTIKLKGLVDDTGRLVVTLPAGTKSGEVDVLVIVQGMDDSVHAEDDAFEELMNFHKGNRLDGISLQELVSEGRR